MARALADFRREFVGLKEVIEAAAKRAQDLESDVGAHKDHIHAGGLELAGRLKVLAKQGVKHTTLAPYLTDQEVALIVKEMDEARASAKDTARKLAEHLQEHRSPIIRRANQYIEDLEAEIVARRAKRSSRLLRINQSVSQMSVLLGEVARYLNSDDSVYQNGIFHNDANFSDRQFDRLYQEAVTKALTASGKVLRANDAQGRLEQGMSHRIGIGVLNKVRTQYRALQTANTQAKLAQKRRDSDALNLAKKNAKLARLRARQLIDPYERALKDREIMDNVDHWKDGAKARATATAIVNYTAVFTKELAAIVALKIIS